MNDSILSDTQFGFDTIYADTNVQIDASAHQLKYDLRHSFLFVQHIILLF